MTDTGVMSDADAAHVGATDGRDDHASGHGQTPVSEPLGPVDLTAWAYAIAGAAVGIVVALALLVARGG